jgi:N-acyl amino acid synthase of PEP-CTERM/exosortase system
MGRIPASPYVSSGKTTVTDTERSFNDLFEIVPADTPALKRQAYRLRYNVFCVEGRLPGFDAWRFPNGLETDPFDAHSVQCLVKYKPTSAWAGMVRLVLPCPEALERSFPVEAIPGSISATDQHRALDRRHLAEISRLILAEPFRQPRDRATSSAICRIDDPSPHSVITHRHLARLALIGLLAGTLQLTLENSISAWLAAMEPSLARLLRGLGVVLHPIGPEIPYHGSRRVYLGEVNQVVETWKRINPGVWSIVRHAARSSALSIE